MPDLIEVLRVIRTTGRELYIHTQALEGARHQVGQGYRPPKSE
jgi:hypothetical protein